MNLSAEIPDAKRKVYLITFAHTTRKDLDAPDKYTRQQIADKVLDACHNPVEYNNRTQPIDVLKMVVAREPHSSTSSAAGRFHFHVPLLAATSFRFLMVKNALRHKHRLASHWGCSHNGYHTAVSYLVIPSPEKPLRTMDHPNALRWAKDGAHPELLDAAQEPNTASALRARHEGKVKACAEQGKAEARASELDVYPVIVQHGFRNTPDDHNAHKRLIVHLREYPAPSEILSVSHASGVGMPLRKCTFGLSGTDTSSTR